MNFSTSAISHGQFINQKLSQADSKLNPHSSNTTEKIALVKFNTQSDEGNYKKSRVRTSGFTTIKKELPELSTLLAKDREEFDWSKDFPTFTDCIVDTPQGLPLSDSDLVLFKNDFSGILPRNGIRASDFYRINELYVKIVTGKTNFIIEGQESFVTKVHEALKKIMEFSIGRDLLIELIEQSKLDKIPLVESLDPNIMLAYLYHDTKKVEFYQIKINTKNHAVIMTESKTGLKLAIPQPFFIALAHELIHLLHLVQGTWNKNRLHALNNAYHNEEELITISGMNHEIESTNQKSPASESEEFPWSNDIPDIYNPLNENTFGISLGLYARCDHQGLEMPMLCLENVKQVIKYYQQLQSYGFSEDANEWKADCLLLISKFLASPFDPRGHDAASALMLAVSFLEFNQTELLLKQGVSPYSCAPGMVDPIFAAFKFDVIPRDMIRLLMRYAPLPEIAGQGYYVQNLYRALVDNYLVEEVAKFREGAYVKLLEYTKLPDAKDYIIKNICKELNFKLPIE